MARRGGWIGVLLLGLTACPGDVDLVGLWVGTVSDGEPILLDITVGAPDVEAELTIGDGAGRALTGMFADPRLDLSTNDDRGAVNFNADVVGAAMTGSFVMAEIGNPIATGGSFEMTKE